MAGTVIRVMPKRTLDFTSVQSGTASAEEIVLAQNIDVSMWREVSLMVRTHSSGFPGANIGKIEIYALMEGRTPEDPALLFTTTTQLATVTIDNTVVAPSFTVNGVTSPFGSMLKIAAKGTRTSSNGTNQIQAAVSIDLSCKSA